MKRSLGSTTKVAAASCCFLSRILFAVTPVKAFVILSQAQQQHQLLSSSATSASPSATSAASTGISEDFQLVLLSKQRQHDRRRRTFLSVFAPPGSGYFSEKDEVSTLPASYEPMMEYPGTMRPGRTPENIPFQDLPIGDDDPDPVPWPHFQQIEWHHRWDPPHEHATPMELFIEQQGRWATPELEAEMRAGARRGVREKKESEEAERRGTIITDDDEYDDEMEVDEAPVSLGDGIFGQLGSDADRAATAAAVNPKNQKGKGFFDDEDDEEEEKDEDDEEDSALDDFLFDLGLDSELDGGEDESDNNSGDDVGDALNRSGAPKTVAKSLRDLESDDDEEDEVGGSMASAIHVEEDDEDLDFDEEDELDSESTGGPVPLDDFGGSEDGLDDDIFDEGGFDFDDDFDGGGDDMW